MKIIHIFLMLTVSLFMVTQVQAGPGDVSDSFDDDNNLIEDTSTPGFLLSADENLPTTSDMNWDKVVGICENSAAREGKADLQIDCIKRSTSTLFIKVFQDEQTQEPKVEALFGDTDEEFEAKVTRTGAFFSQPPIEFLDATKIPPQSLLQSVESVESPNVTCTAQTLDNGGYDFTYDQDDICNIIENSPSVTSAKSFCDSIYTNAVPVLQPELIGQASPEPKVTGEIAIDCKDIQ